MVKSKWFILNITIEKWKDKKKSLSDLFIYFSERKKKAVENFWVRTTPSIHPVLFW